MKPRARAHEVMRLREEGLSDVEIAKKVGLPSAAQVRRIAQGMKVVTSPTWLKCSLCGRPKMFLERDGLCRSCAE